MSNSAFAGYMLVAISSVTFAAKGIFAKLLYGYGIDPITVQAFRFVIAAPFFWALLFLYQTERVGTGDLAIMLLSGFFGFYLASLADFYGLLYLDASLERTILYVYPTIVVILAALFFKEKIGNRKIAALALTYIGLMLSLKIFSGNLNGHLIGAGLVFFAAIISASSYILTEALSRRVSTVKISAYSTTACAAASVGTWLASSAFASFQEGTVARLPHGMKVWGIFFLLAFASTFIPLITLAMGIKRIGAGRAAIVSSIGPIVTAILAAIFLGEQMDITQIIGMILVIAGVLVVSCKDNKIQTEGI